MRFWISPGHFWNNPLHDYRTTARPRRHDLSAYLNLEARKHAFLKDRDAQVLSGEVLSVVGITGAGFVTYAYSIFSLNIVIPILGILYYNGTMPHKYEIALNIATLGGAMFGHALFGVLADRYGRRKMNVTALNIVLGSTLGFLMSSPGLEHSMSFIGWLLFWRVILGIGIGGNATINAVICAEFAPTRLRGKMLRVLVSCQAVGQMAASGVTLAIVASHRNILLGATTPVLCEGDCTRTLDSTWRLLVGLGALPAAVSLLYMHNMPESARFVFEAMKIGVESASLDINYYCGNPRAIPPQPEIRNPSDIAETSYYGPSQSAEFFAGRNQNTTESSTGARVTGRSDLGNSPNLQSSLSRDDVSVSSVPEIEPLPFREDEIPYPTNEALLEYFQKKGNWRTLAATSASSACADLMYYALLLNARRVTSIIWYDGVISRKAVYSSLIDLCWQLPVTFVGGSVVGFALYRNIDKKFGRRNTQLVGFALLFLAFLFIGLIFSHFSGFPNYIRIITTLVPLLVTQVLFFVGPSTTTYMEPAELFPTRYRASCHGISSAIGKFGGILGVLIGFSTFDNGRINYTTVPKWLGYSILVISPVAIAGFIVTLRWIPSAEYGPEGKEKTLEEWEEASSRARDSG